MSCADGSCTEPLKRRRALIMLGLMMLVFIVLSGFSFVDSRHQITPDRVAMGPHQATDGKRVFQAYNCMDCHTLVGNGAYLAPDLTKEYASVGPAWLAAFLPSAGAWPTRAAVQAQLMNAEIAADAGVNSIEAYYAKYPGAKVRIERRGGGGTYMPNLPFRGTEVGELIAYMKYTSAMNTEGWPPKVMTGNLERRLALLYGNSRPLAGIAPATGAATGPAVSAAASPAERGAQLAQASGCIACHSTADKRVVGPPWGGLYGSEVKLADGGTVSVDEAYLIESIFAPNAKIVAGYPTGMMPSYNGILSNDDANAIVEYIRSLEKQ